MSVPTDAQERTIHRIMSHPDYTRSEVRPLADGSREVWAYGHDGALVVVVTVFTGGNTGTRPGFRPTTDTYIGDPR